MQGVTETVSVLAQVPCVTVAVYVSRVSHAAAWRSAAVPQAIPVLAQAQVQLQAQVSVQLVLPVVALRPLRQYRSCSSLSPPRQPLHCLLLESASCAVLQSKEQVGVVEEEGVLQSQKVEQGEGVAAGARARCPHLAECCLWSAVQVSLHATGTTAAGPARRNRALQRVSPPWTGWRARERERKRKGEICESVVVI